MLEKTATEVKEEWITFQKELKKVYRNGKSKAYATRKFAHRGCCYSQCGICRRHPVEKSMKKTKGSLKHKNDYLRDVSITFV